MDLMREMGMIVGAATPGPAESSPLGTTRDELLQANKRANERATQAFRLMLQAEEEKTELLRALRHVLENDTDIDWQMVAEVVRKYEGPKH